MEESAEKGTKQTLIVLIGLLCIGTLLRLYGLDGGLWHDELVTAVKYVRMPLGDLFFTYDSENQHLLYSIFANISVSLFGESAWAIRLPAVIFGVGSLWALYLLGNEVSEPRESVLSVALLTFSYHHVWFSQNARGYTGLLFWVTLGSLLLVRAFRHNHQRLWIWYAVTAALGVYTQLMMIFVVAGHFLIYLMKIQTMRRGEQWRGLGSGFILSGVLTLFLYLPVLPQMFSTLGEESTVLMWKKPLWTILEFIRGMQVYFAGTVVILSGAVLLIAGAVSYWRSNRLVVYLMLIPAVLGSIVTLGMGHPLWPRFFFFDAGFAALILVRGLMRFAGVLVKLIPGIRMDARRVGTVLCCLLILLSVPTIPRAWAPKQDYEGVISFIRQERLPGDAVVIVGRADLGLNDYYKVQWDSVKTLEELNRIRNSSRRTWAVYIFPQDAEALYPELMNIVQQDFKVVRTFDGTLGGGTIYVLRFDRDST